MKDALLVAVVLLAVTCLTGLVDQHNKILQLREEIVELERDTAGCYEHIAQLTSKKEKHK